MPDNLTSAFGALATMACALIVTPTVLRAQSSRATTSRDADAVLATMTEMWSALEAGDVDRYATFVHADFTQFGENDSYLSEGKSAELRSMKEYVQRAKGVHTDMHNAQVTVRGDVAWVTYYWTDGGMIDGKRSSSRGNCCWWTNRARVSRRPSSGT